MAKRRKQHEAKAPDVVADPVQPAVPAEHDEPAAAALVAGDSGDAAGAAGGEHPGEPPAEAGAADGAAVVDGADGADAETETEAAEGVAPTPVHQSGGVSDDAGEQDQSPSEVSGEQAAPEDAGAGGADTAGQEPGATGVEASGGSAEGSGEDHGGSGIDAQTLNDSDGSADGAAPVPAGPETLDRVALCGAIGAYQEAFMHGAWLEHAVNGSELVDQQLPDAVFDDMAAFVRQIGERATPDVLAQQLVIKKHRASPEISEPERIAFTAFAGVLLALDRFVAGEFARKEQEKAVADPPPAVPIEDTTIELVDAPLATWGGRG